MTFTWLPPILDAEHVRHPSSALDLLFATTNHDEQATLQNHYKSLAHINNTTIVRDNSHVGQDRRDTLMPPASPSRKQFSKLQHQILSSQHIHELYYAQREFNGGFFALKNSQKDLALTLIKQSQLANTKRGYENGTSAQRSNAKVHNARVNQL